MPCHATLVWAVCCMYIHTLVLRNKQSMSYGITMPSSTHRHETPQVLSLCSAAQPLGPVALIAAMALFPLLSDACRIPRKLSKSLATSRSQCDTILDCFLFFFPSLLPLPRVCLSSERILAQTSAKLPSAHGKKDHHVGSAPLLCSVKTPVPA